MKSPTAQFLDRLVYRFAGEQPVYILKIYYSGASYFLCSTDRIRIGSDDYLPYVKKVGDIRVGSSDEHRALQPPSEVNITLFRNSTTENLFSTYHKFKKVYLWKWFKSLSSFSDALEMGTYVIDQIMETNQGDFTIRCLSDESKLEIEIQQQLLNTTDYPLMVEDYVDQPWPLVLGDMTNPTTDDYRYLDGYLSNAVPSFCTHKNDYKFMFYGHPSILCQSPSPRAYKYESGYPPKMLAHLYSILYGGNVFTTPYSGARYWIDINPPDETNYGNHRLLRILPYRSAILGGYSNNCTTWANACDRDRSTVATLNTSEYILLLTFELPESGLGNYIPPGWTDNCYMRIKIGLNIDSISGTVNVALIYKGAAPTSMGNYNTTGYKETTATYTDPGGGPMQWENLGIKIQLTAGTSAQVDGVHLIFNYYDDMEPIPPRSIAIKATRRRLYTLEKKEKTIPEWRGGKIFIEAKGPADQSGMGWDEDSPFSILYFLLVHVAGLSSSEIDNSNWQSVNSDMGSGWSYGMAIVQRTPIKDLMEMLLRESGLRMWRDDFNKMKLYRINKAGSLDMTFVDEKGGVYLTKGFNWGFTDDFYNRFEMPYKWSYASNEFQLTYLKDHNNDSDLQTSYNNYASAEREYPYPECEWTRDSAVMDKLFAVLKTYWKQLKVFVEFETSQVGCLLEPGDTIRTNHASQFWSQTAKNFQVVRLVHGDNGTQIRAVEIIT